MNHEWNLNHQLPTPIPDMDRDSISSCVVLLLPPHKHPCQSMILTISLGLLTGMCYTWTPNGIRVSASCLHGLKHWIGAYHLQV